MKKNTSQHWDTLWLNDSSSDEDQYILKRERLSVRWDRMKGHIAHHFSSFEGLKVVEIGAGLGTYSALMAAEGADVTILDYSPKAIDRAKAFYQHNKLNASFVLQDALHLPSRYLHSFDISLSVGLTEHFLGDNRVKINQVHADVLKKGGQTFICVPNAYNLPYRLHKFGFERLGLWPWGEEYPYTRKELFTLAKKIGLSDCQIFGESLWYSLNFINPLIAYKKFRKIKPDYQKVRLHKETSTPFDQYLSYSLILTGVVK